MIAVITFLIGLFLGIASVLAFAALIGIADERGAP